MASVDGLHEQLLKARENLKSVDENIKKLTGRTFRTPGSGPGPGGRRGPPGRVPGGDVRSSRGGRLFAMARRGLVDDARDGGPPAKRRNIGTAFGRMGSHSEGRGRRHQVDSGDEDIQKKHAIQSSVVAPLSSLRSRKDIMDEQTSDTKGKARNRRMFGLLLGTLQKFKNESQATEDKEKQRKDIEEKLDQRAVQEKEDMKREREELFTERRQKQAELRQLEIKMGYVEAHKTWESQYKNLRHFIRTKAKPHIFYLPKEMIPATIRKQQDTSKLIDEMIEERKKKLEKDLEAVSQRDHREHMKVDDHEDEDEDMGDKAGDWDEGGGENKVDNEENNEVEVDEEDEGGKDTEAMKDNDDKENRLSELNEDEKIAQEDDTLVSDAKKPGLENGHDDHVTNESDKNVTELSNIPSNPGETEQLDEQTMETYSNDQTNPMEVPE
ncbi:pinin-like [Tubulanus polymorphus]|uniref:pinin-like n=1 Tax=Tubulanus polymorphus TaxID=672921 RepID=UPI003DA1F038